MAKVLIIDDDPDIVESTKVVLENKNYEVVSASSGAEGIERAKEIKPDVIILDVMMEAGDSGFDVARAIKKADATKNIPILMVTAIKEKTGFDFKHEAGDDVWLPVDDYVDKPLKPNELLSKIAKLLKEK